jgi:hypothetical protein
MFLSAFLPRSYTSLSADVAVAVDDDDDDDDDDAEGDRIDRVGEAAEARAGEEIEGA